MVGAVDKHLALIGFMGAGKSRLGRELARLTGGRSSTPTRRSRSVRADRRAVRARRAEFRRIEEQVVAEALAGPTAVIALGGGAVLSEATRRVAARTAFVVWIPVDVRHGLVAGHAARVGRLPETASSSNGSYEERLEIYDAIADGSGARCTSPSCSLRSGSPCSRVASPRRRGVVIADERVAGIHELQLLASGGLDALVPSGEEAKTRPSSSGSGVSSRSDGTAGSSASAADRRPTSPGSSPRRISAESVGCRCRPRSSEWSTRRSAGRPGSTPRREEPGGRVPLPAAGLRRSELPRHAARRGASGRDGRGGEDRPPRGPSVVGASRRKR